MTVPTSEKQIVKIAMAFGSTAGSEQVALNFSEDSTSYTGNRIVRRSYEIPVSTTDASIDLSTLVDTATWIAVVDKSGQAISYALSSGVALGSRHQVAASGVSVWKNANATPPTLYLSNADASNKAFGEIIILGASA